MREDFDHKQYWIDRGKSYIRELRLRTPFFAEQEAFIVDLIRDRSPKTILELGCGYGRVSRRIAEAMPARLFGLDISPTQVDNARQHCRQFPRFEFAECDVTQGLPPIGPVDLVVAIELFFHLSPSVVETLIDRIFKITKTLLHDFDPNPIGPFAAHICHHDYPGIYGRMGLKWKAIHRGEHHFFLVTS